MEQKPKWTYDEPDADGKMQFYREGMPYQDRMTMAHAVGEPHCTREDFDRIAVLRGWMPAPSGNEATPAAPAFAQRDSDSRKPDPLTWATPKPFDAFPGYSTASDTDTQPTGPAHPLQKLADVHAPIFGSAFLLKKA
jgi:hypothetical protein